MSQRVNHRRLGQPIVAVPRPEHAPRCAPQRLPVPRHPEGPQPRHGGARRAAALHRRGHGDPHPVRGGHPEQVARREPHEALPRLRRLQEQQPAVHASAGHRPPRAKVGGGQRRRGAGEHLREERHGDAVAAEDLPEVAAVQRALQRLRNARRGRGWPPGRLPPRRRRPEGPNRRNRQGPGRGPPRRRRQVPQRGAAQEDLRRRRRHRREDRRGHVQGVLHQRC
mmetsp:Transcript_88447/g.250635  ORF Transcript_88447/g.250635 Transcript_88447/m.250635 type:complete len:224 (+) Transcript_88447:1302-1973(+)